VFRYDIPTRLAITAAGHHPVVAASPGALQGEIAISLPGHIRLVMVAENPPSLTEPLISDILRALALSPDQVLQLTPERVAMLPQDSRCNSWRLGTDAPLLLAGARFPRPLLMNFRPARLLAWRSGNKSAHMNTISTLNTADLPRAWQIETTRPRFSVERTNLCQQSGRTLSELQLTVDGEMAAFAITQVVLDEATLFNIAVDPLSAPWPGRALLEHVIDEVEKRGSSRCGWRCARRTSPPSRSMKA
jgi:DNA polymerase-3 subunit psi